MSIHFVRFRLVNCRIVNMQHYGQIGPLKCRLLGFIYPLLVVSDVLDGLKFPVLASAQ